MTGSDWISRFDGLMRLAPDVRDELVKRSRVVAVPSGTVIFGPGKPPEHLLLLLDGTVRVQQTSEEGREIVLYRVRSGESCVLTTACLLAFEDYTAEGVAETDVTAAAIPKQTFDWLVAHSSDFREFVFSAYSRRMMDLFHVIEEIAFQRMDIRAAQKILELSDGNGEVHATHQQIATELGTAREVVSRMLSEFQRREWVSLSRGVIVVRDRDALEHMSKH